MAPTLPPVATPPAPPPTESPPKRRKVDEEAATTEEVSSSDSDSKNEGATASDARAQPTASEPVYPVQASILQRPAREATASELVQADDDVRVLGAQAESDFHKGC